MGRSPWDPSPFGEFNGAYFKSCVKHTDLYAQIYDLIQGHAVTFSQPTIMDEEKLMERCKTVAKQLKRTGPWAADVNQFLEGKGLPPWSWSDGQDTRIAFSTISGPRIRSPIRPSSTPQNTQFVVLPLKADRSNLQAK